MPNPTNPDALSDLVNGIEERVSPGSDWHPGVVITGDTAAAGTAFHEGEKIGRSEYEQRLQEHRERRGPPAANASSGTPQTIFLNVVERETGSFPGTVRRRERAAE